SNLTFIQAGSGANNPTAFVFVQHVVNGQPVSFHHNSFVYHQCGPGKAIITSYNRGVYWRNTWTNDIPGAGCGYLTSNTAFSIDPNVTDGAVLWNAPSTLGTLDSNGDQNAYFETNLIVNFTNNAIDQNDGSRIVVRFNTFQDSSGANHGHDSSPIGTRQLEYYN